MKVKTVCKSATGLALLALAYAPQYAAAFPGYGGIVDSNCAGLGNPLSADFQPQVSGDCFACHNDGAGGSGPGKTAYLNQNWEFFCPAVATNVPPIANANGPYTAETNQAISFSSAGSSDSDGQIVSWMWDFGDGSTSAEPNPSHAYAATGNFTASLTVMDDAGDSDSGTARVSISAPVVNEPNISLSTTDVAFGQVEVNTMSTGSTVVSNTGTQTLDVTSITPCTGTSTEFSWSPSSFNIQPGSTQTVSVMYAPADENSDSGCIEIASNDPDQNPVMVNVDGTGFTPLPQMMDLDVARLGNTKRVSLKRVKPIGVKVVAVNPGSIDATASARLTGTQNGVVVYEETSDASAPVGGRVRIKFPEYTPTEVGNIEWSVTLDDEDPDVDAATAVTRVVR